MNEKPSLLHQATELLKQDNHTDLADELAELVEDLLDHLHEEETTALESSKQAIDRFLETNKALLQKHEELTNIADRKTDLTILQGHIEAGQGVDDEKQPSGSRRDRRGKTAMKIAAGVAAFFAVSKLRGKSVSPEMHNVPAPLPAPHEQLPTGPKRQQVLTAMQEIIAADNKRPIGYDFDDTSLTTKDRDINCSGLVYEVVQRRAGFEVCSGGVTSASLYQSMLKKGRSAQPLLKKGTSTVNIAGIQPGDVAFWASTNPDFKRRNGSRPAKVNRMPIHHSAMIQSVHPDGTFTVLESTGSAGVQVKKYDAKRRLDKRKDEIHVVRMPYDSVA